MSEFKDWSKIPSTREHLVAPNISRFFVKQLLDMLEHYSPAGECLLVAEPKEVISVLQGQFPDIVFYALGYEGEKGETPEKDLCIIQPVTKKYDSIFSQATLEHVCRPSIFVENMANMCKQGGYIFIHTVGPDFQLHRIPVDCVRFLRDFWFELCKYLPIELVGWFGDTDENSPRNQVIAYRKL